MKFPTQRGVASLARSTEGTGKIDHGTCGNTTPKRYPRKKDIPKSGRRSLAKGQRTESMDS